MYVATYVTCLNGEPQNDYAAVVARDGGAPGYGRYGIAFFAPRGPNFSGVSELAFRSEGDGYAVGNETSVRLKNGVWREDDNARESGFTFRALDAGRTSYWAIITVEDPNTVNKLFSAGG